MPFKAKGPRTNLEQMVSPIQRRRGYSGHRELHVSSLIIIHCGVILGNILSFYNVKFFMLPSSPPLKETDVSMLGKIEV